MEKTTKVLILGGTGIIGRHLSTAALARGFDVFVVSRGVKPSSEDGVTYITADARNERNLTEATKDMKFDTIVDLVSFNDSQLQSMMNVFAEKCQQYIFVSSSTVYDSSDGKTIDENTKQVTTGWTYPIFKSLTEDLFTKMCDSYSVQPTIVRPYITYSEQRISFGEWEGADFVEILQTGRPVILGDELAMSKTTLTHAKDLAQGMAGLIGNPRAYGEAVHITSDESATWAEVVQAAAVILNKEVMFIDTPIENVKQAFPNLVGKIEDRCMDRVFDNSKIKAIAPEFSAQYSIDRGYREALKTYNTHSVSYIFQGKYDRMILKLSGSKYRNTIAQYQHSVIKKSIKSYIRYIIGYYAFLHKTAQLVKNVLRKILRYDGNEYATGSLKPHDTH